MGNLRLIPEPVPTSEYHVDIDRTESEDVLGPSDAAPEDLRACRRASSRGRDMI